MPGLETGSRFPEVLEIVNPNFASSELQYRALETLPPELKPGFWNGSFIFDDYRRANYSFPSSHIENAVSHNIAPFTTLKLRFRDTAECFVPDGLEIDVPGQLGYFPRNEEERAKRDAAGDLMRATNVALLSGKAPNRIDVDCDSTSGFEDFRKTYLPTLKAGEYGIRNMELWLSWFSSGSDYSKGIVGGVVLRLDRNKIVLSGLDYDEYHGIPEEQREQALAWFDELKASIAPQA